MLNSDVIRASQEAAHVLLNGGNPYTHIFQDSIPAGTPLPYPPGEVIWYAIPVLITGSAQRMDQLSGIGILFLLGSLAPIVGASRAALSVAIYGTFGLASFSLS